MLSEQSDTRVKLIISPRCGEDGWRGARGQVELAGVLQQHARREAGLDPEVRCFLCRVLALPRFVLVGKLTGTKKQPWSACGVLLSLAEAQHEVEAVVVCGRRRSCLETASGCCPPQHSCLGQARFLMAGDNMLKSFFNISNKRKDFIHPRNKREQRQG